MKNLFPVGTHPSSIQWCVLVEDCVTLRPPTHHAVETCCDLATDERQLSYRGEILVTYPVNP
jgi:hypothetical protein